MKHFLDSDLVEVARGLGEEAQGFSGKTVLMTGARGFLGRHFSEVFAHLNEHVLEKPCTFVGMDNLLTAGEAGANVQERPNFTFVKQDVTKPIEYDGQVDYVIHAAGIASPFYYRAYPLETLEVAITGTRNALELATRQHARFTFFSSSEIYGDPDPVHVPTQESYRGSVSCRGPRACYDESKRVGETLCYVFHEKFGTATTAIRPFNVYGPGQRLDDGRIIPDLMSAAFERRPIVLFSDGRATRSFCYIRDAVRAMLLILLAGAAGEAYNVGNDEEVSIGDVARIAAGLESPALPITFETSQDRDYLSDNPQRRCPDLTKLKKLGGWTPEIKVREGLARTLRSYREAAGA